MRKEGGEREKREESEKRGRRVRKEGGEWEKREESEKRGRVRKEGE